MAPPPRRRFHPGLWSGLKGDSRVLTALLGQLAGLAAALGVNALNAAVRDSYER
jgi:hypothetical protein